MLDDGGLDLRLLSGIFLGVPSFFLRGRQGNFFVIGGLIFKKFICLVLVTLVLIFIHRRP